MSEEKAQPTAVAKGAKGAKRAAIGFARDERGDFGIGQIAAIVAGVVIVGVVITVVTGLLPEWIEQLWSWISELFDSAKNGI